MKKIYTFLMAPFFFFNANFSFCQQAGTADPSFNLADSSITELRSFLNQTVITLSSGKILAGGTRLVRFYESGYADKSFIIGTTHNFGFINAIVEQADGKLILAGDFTSYNGTNFNHIVRLKSNGAIDNSFMAATNNDITSLALQSDGKIVLGGNFTSCNGTSSYYIARLNSNGSTDTSFHIGTGFDNFVKTCKVQPDGRILIGGSFTSFDGISTNRILRLNTTGLRDNSFTIGTGFDQLVNSISLQSNGKIIVVGDFTDYNGSSVNRIIRLQANGALDPTFISNSGFDNTVTTAIIEPSGKIIAAGLFTTYNGSSSKGLVRLSSTGSIDNTFSVGTGINTWGLTTAISSIARLQNGRIIVCGNSFSNYNSNLLESIAEINSTGGFYSDFNNLTGFNADVKFIIVQPDGKSIIGGDFTSYDGYPCSKVVRLDTAGNVDVSFNAGNTFSSWTVNSISLQSDNKLIVVPFNGYIKRLESNGSLDPNFNSAAISNGYHYCSAIQPDGKIIIAGTFSTFNGVSRNSIVRMNTDGSVDTTFSTGNGAGFNNAINVIGIQNGKIILGGDFTSFDGNAVSRILRLNSDGSMDNTFATGSGFDQNVRAITIQTDGKIVVGGLFTTYSGIICNHIVRINPNGSRDLTFNVGTAFDNYVYSIAVQADGGTLVGGEFSSYNGIPAKNIIRLKSDGSLDETFQSGTGFNNTVYAVALQSDDKVLAGGTFSSYNGKIRTRIERLFNYSCVSDILVNTTDASCGLNNGSISLGAVSGGKAPFTYNVNNLGFESSTNYTAVSEGGYDLQVMDDNGCVYTAPQITVLGNPTPYDVTVTSSNSACGNSNGSVSLDFVSGGTFPYQYNFNGLGFSANTNYSNLVAGAYSLEVKDANNCIYIAPSVSVVNDDINYNVQFSSSDTLFTAPPFNVHFTNTTSDTVSNAFTWFFGDGSSFSGVTPPMHVYTINGNYSVSLLASNKINGCTDTLVFTNYIHCSGGPTGLCNHTVAINEASPINGCVGGSATLTCTSNAASPSYQWNINGVPIGGATQSSYTAQFSGFYNVTVYNFNGCPINSATVIVNFNNPAPMRPVISQFGNIQPCSNDTVVLSVSPGFTSYLWSNGDTAHSIKVGAAGIYTVMGINLNGCSSLSLPQNVTASPLLAPDICMVTVDTAVLKNVIIWEKSPNLQIDSFIVLKETSIAGVFKRIGAQSYAALSEFTDTSSRPLIRSDRYGLAIKDTCGSLTIPGTIHKTMHLQITPGIGTSRNLSWNPQEGVYFPSYEIWSGNPPVHPFSPIDTIASTQNTYTDLSPVDGIDTKYLIQIVLPSGGCTSTAKTFATKIRSGSNTAGNRIIAIPNPLHVPSIRNEGVFISPNPSSGIFTIQVNAAAAAQVFVYDILGNEILHKELSKLNKQQLDLSGFADGFYECRIVGENVNVAKKLVKN